MTFAPTPSKRPHPDLAEIRITEEEIAARVAELGRQISRDYEGKDLVLVGILTLVPGLPLDGGRVLTSLVWRLTGNMHRGTIVAAWGGRIAAVLVLFWPWVMREVFHTRPAITDGVVTSTVCPSLSHGMSCS